MSTAAAVKCSLATCRNRTLNASGRCRFHESTAATASTLSALPSPVPAIPTAVDVRDFSEVTPIFEGESLRLTNHTFSGPATIYSLNGVAHRLDAPAVIRSTPDGEEVEWWHEGERHRGDGPAVIRADGTEEWWYRHNEVFLDGTSPDGIPSHLRSGAHYAFDVADQQKLVEAGVDIEEAIEIALDEDLSSAEAVLAILDGAPTEWARSYDEGSAS